MVQSVGWTEVETYGGKLVENIVQAISRDVLAEAMYRLSMMKDFEIVMHVHDEAIAEVDAVSYTLRYSQRISYQSVGFCQ